MFRLHVPNPAEVEAQRKKKAMEVKQNVFLFAVAVVGLRLAAFFYAGV
jgi:hypothetical protein